MSAPDLDAIRARAEAATEGPWGSATTDSGFAVHRGAHYTVALYLSRLDAEFIAHAREDVPALLAEVERLRVERDQAREECGHAKAMRKFASEELDQFIAAKSRADATIARVQKAVESHIGAPCGCNAIAYQVRAAIEGTDS